MANEFIQQLTSLTGSDWKDTIDQILPEIHEVDRVALQIWFRFHPVELRRFLDSAEDREAAKASIAMIGDFDLENSIDISHHFLYGHRYWRSTKAAIEASIETASGSVLDMIRSVAKSVAVKEKVDESLTLAIAAVGVATLAQVGEPAFTASSADIKRPSGMMAGSPDSIVAAREKDDSQGIFGFLKTVDKKFSITYLANKYSGQFPVLNDQEVTQAAASDRSRDWRSLDPRCWEGPVPVECTAASCGTCWVGVLGGTEKLSPVTPRERRRMKVFGYDQPADEKPFLRLACQARATGNATLVISPWNAVFGKQVYDNIEEVELEPVTTSAKALRETIASATENDS